MTTKRVATADEMIMVKLGLGLYRDSVRRLVNANAGDPELHALHSQRLAKVVSLLDSVSNMELPL